MALLLAGCASLQGQAPSLSSPLLCYIGYAGTPEQQGITSAELAKRRFTCSPYDVEAGRQEFAANEAYNAQLRAAYGATLIHNSQQQTSPQVNCTSHTSGAQTYTNCH